ncbi:MAG: hypothetical protein ACYC43_12100 [Burkholderiales bacterium]
MKYLDGQFVELGDYVDLGGGMTGVVVCNFDNNQFAPDYPKAEWAGPTGIMVKSEQAGLVHFSEPDIDLVLLKRANS